MLRGYNTNMTPLFNHIYLEASGPLPLAYFFYARVSCLELTFFHDMFKLCINNHFAR